MDTSSYEEKTTIHHSQLYYQTPLGFVYVPKTGGTYLSIDVLPGKYEHHTSYLPPTIAPSRSWRSSAIHMPASMVKSMIKEGTPMFTILRDPYDRTCSEYYFFKSKPHASRMFLKPKFFFDKIYAIYNEGMSVEDYLEWSIDNPTYPTYYDTLTPKDFDIVGITEDIASTIKLLKCMYDVDAGMGDYNKNDNKKIRDPYKTGFSRSVFESKNPAEYDLYYESFEKFNSLCKENNIK